MFSQQARDVLFLSLFVPLAKGRDAALSPAPHFVVRTSTFVVLCGTD